MLVLLDQLFLDALVGGGGDPHPPDLGWRLDRADVLHQSVGVSGLQPWLELLTQAAGQPGVVETDPAAHEAEVAHGLDDRRLHVPVVMLARVRNPGDLACRRRKETIDRGPFPGQVQRHHQAAI